MPIDKDITREVVEASVELLRPVMAVVREALFSGPDSVALSKEEAIARLQTLTPEQIQALGEKLGGEEQLQTEVDDLHAP